MTTSIDRQRQNDTIITIGVMTNTLGDENVVLSLRFDNRYVNAVMNDKEVDDLIVALKYYQSLARGN